jgi:hypothetical protein
VFAREERRGAAAENDCVKGREGGREGGGGERERKRRGREEERSEKETRARAAGE